jgi:DNA (cytosine-5)-methyltransferase 1
MTHVDLFTGIGGFALAAKANGIKTVSMCEIDPRCRAFLKKRWKGIPVHDDIRTFDERMCKTYKGAWLLTAGVPCQPASRAGKQRGAEDDRWLWPETLRVLGQIRPAWALFENPPGIGDVGVNRVLSGMEGKGVTRAKDFDDYHRILTRQEELYLGTLRKDIEALGYEVAPPIGIPACALNAPHIRMRYWIMAYSRSTRENTRASQLWSRDNSASESSQQGDVADAEGSARFGVSDREEYETFASHGRCGSDSWGRYVWMPCGDGKVRRAPDDAFGLVDGLHRSVLGGLGNAIVWQIAAKIIAAMKEAEKV